MLRFHFYYVYQKYGPPGGRLISVASPTSVAELSKPSVAVLWLFFCPPPRHHQLVSTGISGAYTHVCWQDSGSRGLLVSVIVVYLLGFPQGHRNRGCLMISDCVHQRRLSFLNSDALNRPSHWPLKKWLDSFCFSPWQHVQTGACHWVIVLLSLLGDLADLKPAVPDDWKSAAVPFAGVLTISFWGFDKENCLCGEPFSYVDSEKKRSMRCGSNFSVKSWLCCCFSLHCSRRKPCAESAFRARPSRTVYASSFFFDLP